MMKNNNTNNDDHFWNVVPKDVKRNITTFLNVKDAYRFSQTCKTIHQDLSLSTLQSIQIIDHQHWHDPLYDVTEFPYCGSFIPIFGNSKTVAVTVSIECLFPGGDLNERGQLYIVAHHYKNSIKSIIETTTNNKDNNINNINNNRTSTIDGKNNHNYSSSNIVLDFSSGRQIWESPNNRMSYHDISFSFHPKQNEVYFLWYKVGNGHTYYGLEVENLRVHETIFDYDNQTFATTYTTLHKQNMIVDTFESTNTFYLEIFLLNLQLLLSYDHNNHHHHHHSNNNNNNNTQQQRRLNSLIFKLENFFGSKGIRTNNSNYASLKTIEQICYCFIEQKKLKTLSQQKIEEQRQNIKALLGLDTLEDEEEFWIRHEYNIIEDGGDLIDIPTTRRTTTRRRRRAWRWSWLWSWMWRVRR